VQLGIRPLTDAMIGLGREALAVGAALAHYRRAFVVPERPRTGRASWTTRPVVLVHGFGHNAGAFSGLAMRLATAGFFDLSTVSYGIDDDVPTIAARIGDHVDAVTTSRAVERVHLVGHSLGGVAIRYWHDVLGGAAQADAVVTLGAPLRGVIWTRLPFLRPPARDLAGGSVVNAVLDRHRGRYDHWTTVGGTFDLVVPAGRAHLDDVEAVDVPAGHAGLLTSTPAAGQVCLALLHAEEVRASASG
jgi:triacylglycerol esterase/lipase EstA (alpha/beta hydrolase family)